MKLSRLADHGRAIWRRGRPLLDPRSLYAADYPSPQAAIDLFQGEWTCRVPGAVTSGSGAKFEDPTAINFIEQSLGALNGKAVLELGPLEGADTTQLERAGARVTAIEANKSAFVRCLIVKNQLDLRASFLLGDFVPFLAQTPQRYDMVFAAGVLYHMQDPVGVLQNICRIADATYIWTHYYDDDLIRQNPAAAKHFSGETKTLSAGPFTVTTFQRIYAKRALTYLAAGFCGGRHVETYWMKLPDIRAVLEASGFTIEAEGADPTHVNGPCAWMVARRRPSAPQT